jgi:uncharacterized damage-inducible protein DinB
MRALLHGGTCGPDRKKQASLGPPRGYDRRMTVIDHFRMLARYNRIANERLYEKCAALDAAEYHRKRPGSFGNIGALLNHILLGDQIWLSRFAGRGGATPPLNSILFETLAELRSARAEQDAMIEVFFERMDDGFLRTSFAYTNHQGKQYVETASVALLHFFNHQTHHRGQVHVMLSQTHVTPPSLDLHRILNP